MEQKTFKVVVVIFIVLFLCSCGGYSKEIIRGAKVPDLKLPDKIDILEPNTAKEPGVNYISPPKLIKPAETFKGGKDGNAVLEPQDWRTMKYGIIEYYRWMETTKRNIGDHNKIFDDNKKTATRSWTEFFKDWTWRF